MKVINIIFEDRTLAQNRYAQIEEVVTMRGNVCLKYCCIVTSQHIVFESKFHVCACTPASEVYLVTSAFQLYSSSVGVVFTVDQVSRVKFANCDTYILVRFQSAAITALINIRS